MGGIGRIFKTQAQAIVLAAGGIFNRVQSVVWATCIVKGLVEAEVPIIEVNISA